MAIPTVITDLSATIASNGPAGSDSPSVLDDYQRAQGAFVRQLYDVVCAGGGGALSASFGALTYTGALTGGTGVVNLGSGQFYKDASGNVGIGATPGARLTVQDSAQLLATFNSTNVNAGYIQLQSSGTNYGYFGSAAALASGAATDVALRYQNKLVLSYQGATATAVLDSSGNLGLGVTPKAWTVRALELIGSPSLSSVVGTDLTYNAYYDGAWKYTATAVATRYAQIASTGAHAWYNAPSGTAGAAISFTQAMTLDSAGQLGIGLTPNAPLSVRKDSSTWEIAKLFNNNGTTAGCVLQFNNNVTPANGWDVGVPNADQFNVRRNASAVFSIDSSGRAMVGTVSVLTGNPALSVKSISQYTATFQQYQNLDYVGVRIENVYAQSAQNATMVQLVNSGGTEVGSIKSTGSATSFNTSSDRRLKSNITAAGDSSIVDDIEVVQYDWTNGGGHVAFGVVAQDLHGVFPDAVSAGDGGVDVSSPWGVDYSKLVPLLIKEVQQLRARVAVLESR